MRIRLAPPLAPAWPGCAARARPVARYCLQLKASNRPALLLTTIDGGNHDEVLSLASRIREEIDAEPIVLVPTSGSGGDAGKLTFDVSLRLEALAGAQGGYALVGATPADCVQVGADPQAGLLQALGLPPPALVLVGLHRGPALGGASQSHAVVAVARSAAQLGLPAVAACLATPTPGAPIAPAEDAVLELLPRVLACLRSAGGRSWPAPANFPRAHFPFPEAGRWALGRELPLPRRESAHSGSSLRGADCWALGDDGADWAAAPCMDAAGAAAGGGGGAATAAAAGAAAGAWRTTTTTRARADAYALLRRAFADGDLLLSINVPPTWRRRNRTTSSSSSSSSSGGGGAAPFASVRPGVLWPCHQVEAPSAGGAVSWRADTADLYGRSLPAGTYGAPLSAGAFVSQDNTGAAVAARNGTERWRRASQPVAGHSAGGSLPDAFTIRRGTTLSDDASCGDVDAVFEGRAAIGTLQAWAPGHPFSLRDELLAAALDECSQGLPQWLATAA